MSSDAFSFSLSPVILLLVFYSSTVWTSLSNVTVISFFFYFSHLFSITAWCLLCPNIDYNRWWWWYGRRLYLFLSTETIIMFSLLSQSYFHSYCVCYMYIRHAKQITQWAILTLFVALSILQWIHLFNLSDNRTKCAKNVMICCYFFKIIFEPYYYLIHIISSYLTIRFYNLFV